MTILHHPADETLARLAAGTLAPGTSLVVETHLTGCPACRARVAACEEISGALFEDLAPSSLAADAFERTLALIERPVTPAPRAMPVSVASLPGGVALPAPLRGRKIGPWRWMGPKVRMSRVAVPEDPTANVILLWVKPNTKLPEHGHTGVEYTHVLKGSYSDGVSRYVPGDLLEADSDFQHRPVVDADGDCMCLAAIEGRLRLNGWIGRILQTVLPS